MTYTHLTQEERYQIHSLCRQGIHLSHIAAELGRCTSTISRELKRNASARGYQAAVAQDKASARQSERRNARQFNAAQWQLVELYLRLGLSPQQVSDRLALEDRLSISTEAIYQYAYANKAQGGDLVSYLRCQKLRRKRYASGRERRGVLKNRVGIEHRPSVVDSKKRIGDWEGDTVIGAGRKGALVTLVERKSRYTFEQPRVSRRQFSLS
jgi:IS30 family transposase